jgi:hypothetical protein
MLSAAVAVRSVQDVRRLEVCSFMYNFNVRVTGVLISSVYICTRIENDHKMAETCNGRSKT